MLRANCGAELTRRERFEALLDNRGADRVPRVLWRHFPSADFKLADFVGATLQFHRQHDLDLLKINPRSSFGIRDLGAEDGFDGDHLGRCRYRNEIIRSIGDWRKLRLIDPLEGWLGHMRECIRQIATGADPDTPVIATIFSPASQAKNLAGAARLAEHWVEHPSEVRAGLEILASSTVRFLKSLTDVRLDGLFYAIQECGLEGLHPSYTSMCADLDHSILTANRYWLNVLHLHGKIINFDEYTNYPVSVLHWDEVESGISVEEGRRQFRGLVCGGIAWPDMGWPDIAMVRSAALRSVERIGSERLILGAGCVIPWQTAPEFIDAFCSFDKNSQ